MDDSSCCYVVNWIIVHMESALYNNYYNYNYNSNDSNHLTLHLGCEDVQFPQANSKMDTE